MTLTVSRVHNENRSRLRSLAGLWLLIAFSAETAAKTEYVGVIDAGSSGTRLFFYEVHPNSVAQPNVEPKMLLSKVEFTKEDGIDNYLCNEPGQIPTQQSQVNTDVINPLLNELLRKGRQMQPPIGANRITVDVFATAGMRSKALRCFPGSKPQEVKKRNAAVQRYYKLIKNNIKQQGFAVIQLGIRTIDGNSEEAMWTWLNLNFVMGTLGKPSGDLEVGGSSTQVVYPVPEKKINPQKNIYGIQLMGRKYFAFARSYLGLGQDDARKALRNDPNASACWPTGFTEAQDTSDWGFPRIPGTATYNFSQCQMFFQNYIAGKLQNQPKPQTERSTSYFVGLDGAWYSYDDFLNGQGPINGLPAAVAQKCSSVSNFKDTELLLETGQNQCVNGTYMSTLMFDNGPTQFFEGPSKLVTQARSNNVPGTKQTELTWTQGYILNHYYRR